VNLEDIGQSARLLSLGVIDHLEISIGFQFLDNFDPGHSVSLTLRVGYAEELRQG